MARTAFAHGMYYIQFAFRDSEGYPMGSDNTPDVVSAGDTTNMYLLRNCTEYVAPNPTYLQAIEQGGQEWRGTYSLGVSNVGNGSFSLSSEDDTLNAFFNNSAVDTTTITGMRISGANVNNKTLPNMYVIISQQVGIMDDASVDDNPVKWKHWVLNNVQIEKQNANANQNGDVNPNPITYNLIPRKSYRTILGKLYSAMNMNIVENNDYYMVIESSNPITVTTSIAAAANPETFTTAYLPLTTHATTSDKLLTVEGDADTLTGFSITTGVATTATETSGDKMVLLFETDFETA